MSDVLFFKDFFGCGHSLIFGNGNQILFHLFSDQHSDSLLSSDFGESLWKYFV
jgi:hypothetical protein